MKLKILKNPGSVLLIPLAAIAFGLSSCEESFEPMAEYKESTIVNFLLRADTSLQYATVIRSYGFGGESSSLTDADVKLWADNKVYTLRDTVLPGRESNNGTPVHCYYTKSFVPVSDIAAELKVETNDGKILTASTKIPTQVTLVYPTGTSLPPRDVNMKALDYFTIKWKDTESSMWYLPSLKIIYKKLEGSEYKTLSFAVPTWFSDYKGKSVPKYPGVSQSDNISFSRSAIDAAMRLISEGDKNKDNYLIVRAVFEVMSLDRHLAAYYMSTHTIGDSFTIQLDENDYTNINGGYGIFGSYFRQTIDLTINGEYINSFGYKTK